MIRFLADENFNNDILRALRRRVPEAELLRVQDSELLGKPDPLVLEWAQQQGYAVLSHDVGTMRGFYYGRVDASLPVPLLFLVHGSKPIGAVIDDLELILLASDESEWQGKIQYLPFESIR